MKRTLLSLFVLVVSAAAAVAQMPASPKLPPALAQAKVAAPPPAVTTSPYDKPAREFVDAFNSGRFDDASKLFNDAMKVAVTPAVMQGLKKQADDQVGAFRSIREVHRQIGTGSAAIEFIAAYEKSDVSFIVAFDAHGKIATVHFDPIVEEKVDPALDRMARGLLAAINARRFDLARANFDDAMKSELTPLKLAAVEAQMRQTFGAFRSITEVHQKTGPTGRSLDFLVAYEKAPVKFTVTFDSKKEIVTGVGIAPASVDPAAR